MNVDTPRKNSWAEQQTTQSLFPHALPMHPTHSEEQRLINIRRRFPLVRVLGPEYAERCNQQVKSI